MYGLGRSLTGAFWESLHRHLTEPEVVQLGCFIGLAFGQQWWLKLCPAPGR